MGVEVKGVRLVLIAAVALGLAACSGTGPIRSSGDVVASAAAKIDKAEQDYQEAKAFAELLLPILPAQWQTRVRAIEAKIERGLELARVAVDAAAQAAELAQVERDLNALRTSTY